MAAQTTLLNRNADFREQIQYKPVSQALPYILSSRKPVSYLRAIIIPMPPDDCDVDFEEIPVVELSKNAATLENDRKIPLGELVVWDVTDDRILICHKNAFDW